MNYLLAEGDLVIARTGASVGRSYLYRRDDGPLVFAGFLIRVTADPKKLWPPFLGAVTQTPRYWNWIRMTSMRSGQPGVNANELANLRLWLPPTVKEQVAIAALLSEMDMELTAVEAELAKVRQTKQGMMQELLSGRIRLA
jgi:type I restriction enzyme S subunit